MLPRRALCVVGSAERHIARQQWRRTAQTVRSFGAAAARRADEHTSSTEAPADVEAEAPKPKRGRPRKQPADATREELNILSRDHPSPSFAKPDPNTMRPPGAGETVDPQALGLDAGPGTMGENNAPPEAPAVELGRPLTEIEEAEISPQSDMGVLPPSEQELADPAEAGDVAEHAGNDSASAASPAAEPSESEPAAVVVDDAPSTVETDNASAEPPDNQPASVTLDAAPSTVETDQASAVEPPDTQPAPVSPDAAPSAVEIETDPAGAAEPSHTQPASDTLDAAPSAVEIETDQASAAEPFDTQPASVILDAASSAVETDEASADPVPSPTATSEPTSSADGRWPPLDPTEAMRVSIKAEHDSLHASIDPRNQTLREFYLQRIKDLAAERLRAEGAGPGDTSLRAVDFRLSFATAALREAMGGSRKAHNEAMRLLSGDKEAMGVLRKARYEAMEVHREAHREAEKRATEEKEEKLARREAEKRATEENNRKAEDRARKTLPHSYGTSTIAEQITQSTILDRLARLVPAQGVLESSEAPRSPKDAARAAAIQEEATRVAHRMVGGVYDSDGLLSGATVSNKPLVDQVTRRARLNGTYHERDSARFSGKVASLLPAASRAAPKTGAAGA